MPLAKISPFLWFPNPLALTAAEYYSNLFNNSPSPTKSPSSVDTKTYNTKSNIAAMDASNIPAQPAAGEILTVNFTLAGQSFIALNGPYLPENPQNSLFPFNEAISLSIDCEDQAEVDYFYNTIVKDGGSEIDCGWVKDKFEVRWQVVPRRVVDLLEGGDQEVRERVMAAMMKMKKPSIAEYEAAAKGS